MPTPYHHSSHQTDFPFPACEGSTGNTKSLWQNWTREGTGTPAQLERARACQHDLHAMAAVGAQYPCLPACRVHPLTSWVRLMYRQESWGQGCSISGWKVGEHWGQRHRAYPGRTYPVGLWAPGLRSAAWRRWRWRALGSGAVWLRGLQEAGSQTCAATPAGERVMDKVGVQHVSLGASVWVAGHLLLWDSGVQLADCTNPAGRPAPSLHEDRSQGTCGIVPEGMGKPRVLLRLASGGLGLAWADVPGSGPLRPVPHGCQGQREGAQLSL